MSSNATWSPKPMRAQTATLALLIDGGYAAAAVDAVAKRAGVVKKNLYRFAANRDELVAQAVSGWTEAFQPAFAQDAGQRAAVAPLLEKGLQAIAQQVLSAEAVGMFRLLQSEFPGREGLLDSYQHNGIQRDWAQTSDLLLAMTIAEPRRRWRW
ncbi:TetR family transcriptional regulator [Serratia marcescens]